MSDVCVYVDDEPNIEEESSLQDMPGAVPIYNLEYPHGVDEIQAIYESDSLQVPNN